MATNGEIEARVAVVTGGASGIGRAAVDQLMASGWKVSIWDLSDAALTAAQSELGASGNIRIAKLDITDEATVEAEIAAIEQDFGPIAGVVNSAGIAADRHVFDTPVDLFRKILDVNVVGTFIVGRAAARVMKQRQRGDRKSGFCCRPTRIEGTVSLWVLERRRRYLDPSDGQRSRE